MRIVPVGGRVDAGQRAERGRLSRAVRTDQSEDLAAFHCEGKVFDCYERVVALREAGDFDAVVHVRRMIRFLRVSVFFAGEWGVGSGVWEIEHLGYSLPLLLPPPPHSPPLHPQQASFVNTGSFVCARCRGS